MVGPEAFTEVKYLEARRQLRALDVVQDVGRPVPRGHRPSTPAGSSRRTGSRTPTVVLVGLGSCSAPLPTSSTSCATRGLAVGVLGVTCFRPWPFDEVREALSRVPPRSWSSTAPSRWARAASSARRCGSRSPATARPSSTTSSPGSAADRSLASCYAASSTTCAPRTSSRDDDLTFADLDEAPGEPREPRGRPGAGSRGGTDDDRAQALPGRHVRGGQPPAGPVRAHRAVRAGRTNSITSGHRACRGCGEALGARVVLDAAMRATDGQDGHGQCDGLSRGLLDAVPRVGLAGAVAALAVRQRGSCRLRRGGLAARPGPR